jgi:hypothetical protein
MSPTFSTAARRAIHDDTGRFMGYVECRGAEPHFGPQAPSILLRREPPALGARELDRTAA